MRVKEIKKAERNIKLKRSTVILGPKGIGKTWLLKKMEGTHIEYPSGKVILSAIMQHYGIQCFRWATIGERLELVIKYLPKTTLLIDNCDNLYKPTIRFIETLISAGTTVICASEHRLYFCREKLELKELSKKESIKFAEELLPAERAVVYRIINHKSLGNPGKIAELARDFQLAVKNQEVDPFNEASIITFFLELKPQMPERIDIFPVWMLFIVGFGALFLKAFLFSNGDFHDAYLVASFGYLALIVYRMMQEGRKKK